MDVASNRSIHFERQPAEEKDKSNVVRACTLYSMNDILYQNGLITLQKKQQVEQEIWKTYHI